MFTKVCSELSLPPRLQASGRQADILQSPHAHYIQFSDLPKETWGNKGELEFLQRTESPVHAELARFYHPTPKMLQYK